MQTDITFRTHPWGMLLLPVIMLAIGVTIGWALIRGNLPFVLWGSVAIIVALVPLVLSVNFFPTTANELGAQNPW